MGLAGDVITFPARLDKIADIAVEILAGLGLGGDVEVDESTNAVYVTYSEADFPAVIVECRGRGFNCSLTHIDNEALIDRQSLARNWDDLEHDSRPVAGLKRRSQ